MREGVRGLLLALGLCMGAARAEEVSEETVEAAAEADTRLSGYTEVSGTPESASDGDLRVSVDTSMLRPPRGYFPVEVELHNTGSTPRVVDIGVTATSSEVRHTGVARRRVEVGPRQRLSAWMPVPMIVRGGIVRVESPGLKLRAFSFYSTDGLGQPLLVLGTQKAFEEGTHLPRVEEGKLTARFLSAENAPRELAAYVGHPRIVVAGDVTALPADVWSALEAYAATGGMLTLLHPPRDVDVRLPLLTQSVKGVVQPYGFGQVRLCAGVEGCAAGLLADADALEADATLLLGPVRVASPPSRWGGNDGLSVLSPLLPGVQAPVGRFLGLITLFVLAVGPGGLLLARRKGPAVLLIAVPAVALVTCLAFVGWSVLVEGFDLHASRYSVTWLDRERDRAATVGFGGYYANLEPEPFQVPVLSALLSSDVDWESRSLEADWTRGMEVTGGFLSARTYQEWGEVAVAPSRARLGVSPEGERLRIRNALGAPLAEGYVRFRGGWWKLPALAEGAEGLASPLPETTRDTVTEALRPSREVEQRLERVLGRLWEPLPEGGFLARLEGPGRTFSAAIPVRLHEGVHLVRGRVDGP